MFKKQSNTTKLLREYPWLWQVSNIWTPISPIHVCRASHEELVEVLVDDFFPAITVWWAKVSWGDGWGAVVRAKLPDGLNSSNVANGILTSLEEQFRDFRLDSFTLECLVTGYRNEGVFKSEFTVYPAVKGCNLMLSCLAQRNARKIVKEQYAF
ncbi:MAG: hypothetical protein ABA06_00470 [Parcubacteria bacterium C7867-001]|nr:MAG: hypothetical protein ABA06_00470 [Parcubacteria bacterium C7867-001]